jgi:hypothetical protein
LSERVTFVLGRDRVDGATLGGGVSVVDGAVVVGASLTTGGGTYVGVYVSDASVVGTSTAVVAGEAGVDTTIGGAGGASLGAGATGCADVAAGGYFSSGASVGTLRGYQMVTATMAAVATTNAVINSPRTDMYCCHLLIRIPTRLEATRPTDRSLTRHSATRQRALRPDRQPDPHITLSRNVLVR